MRLCIRYKNVENARLSEELRGQLRVRLAFALARFDHRVRDITASLADLNGPKGGVDKQCRLVVRLRPRGKVTIEQTAGDFAAAIALAADRAGHTVGRLLKRRRDARTRSRRLRPLTIGSGAT